MKKDHKQKIEEDMMSLSEKLGGKTLVGEDDNLSSRPKKRRGVKVEPLNSLDGNEEGTTLPLIEKLQGVSLVKRKRK